MRKHIELGVNVVLAICAIAFAIVVIRRESGVAPISARAQLVQLSQDIVLVPQWRELHKIGRRMGPESAPIQVIEFSDFECPACRAFASTLKQFEARNPGQIGITFIHYPLKQHRLAPMAASAADCSGEQDRFGELHDLLFAKQDSIGLKSWMSFARDAGVPDSVAFAKCLERGTSPRVSEGLKAGAHLKARGTPTILINGYQLPGNAGLELLEGLVKTIREGKDPRDSD